MEPDRAMRKQSVANVETAPADLTIIGKGTRLDGASLHVAGDLRVDGELRVDDLVVAERMIVSPTGSLSASRIRTRDAVVAGQVDAHLEVEATLVLKDTGRVGGVIIANRLIVEEGGICDGTFTVGPGSTGRSGGSGAAVSLPDDLRPTGSGGE